VGQVLARERSCYRSQVATVAEARGSIAGMTTLLEPVLAPARNDNGGIVPPWLQFPIHILPMPEPPVEAPVEDDE
jgi:hypothetical protein